MNTYKSLEEFNSRNPIEFTTNFNALRSVVENFFRTFGTTYSPQGVISYLASPAFVRPVQYPEIDTLKEHIYDQFPLVKNRAEVFLLGIALISNLIRPVPTKGGRTEIYPEEES